VHYLFHATLSHIFRRTLFDRVANSAQENISVIISETLVISRMAGQLFALNGLWMVC
jgi:hypothetical protein